MKIIFNNLSFRTKVIGTTILLIIETCTALTLISVQVAGTSLLNKTYENLTALRDSKKSQIKRFLNEHNGDIEVLAENPFTREAFRSLKVVCDTDGGGTGGHVKGHTNKKNHTGTASFENPPKGKINTEAVKRALKGEGDTKLINNNRKRVQDVLPQKKQPAFQYRGKLLTLCWVI